MAVTLKGNNGTYEGTSEDSKPLDVPVNTEFNELDTGKTYYFDGETWNEEPPCEGSGFTPTTEQLAAMNSGITTEDVAQIATNENNISLQQNSVAEGGQGYAIINGQRLYMGSAAMPERTGDIWLDGATARESEYLLSSNPLCGISTYKDTLNLATGACTRYILKAEFDGTESWQEQLADTDNHYFRIKIPSGMSRTTEEICSHYVYANVTSQSTMVGFNLTTDNYIRFRPDNARSVTLTDWVNWVTAQYANGSPLTVWCVMPEPTTETITVPSGNTGTVEGYLTRSGTPTPTNPIYPTANEVLVWG